AARAGVSDASLDLLVGPSFSGAVTRNPEDSNPPVKGHREQMWRRAIPRVLQIIGLLSIAGTLAAAVTFFLLADLLQVDEPIERADYILPLAGDGHRVIRAAELYREDVAPVVLWSREYTPPQSRLQNLLVEMGYSLAEPKDFVPGLLEHLGVPS